MLGNYSSFHSRIKYVINIRNILCPFYTCSGVYFK
jgi:hypothetical protein